MSVTLAMEPNAAEQAGMAGLLDARKAMAERAAAVVKGLLAGALPSAEQLDSVAGVSTK